MLDTWFSSALWPFATLGWPEETPELRAFYPTDALVTARDIIFLWVARMIMMGLEFTGEIPFSDVYVHSIIQAPDGRRMSKSLGTGIDPLDLIEGGPRPPVFTGGGDFPAYGADAVRWGLLAMSSGQDVRFSEDKVAQGLQLTNKLWNAARLILLRIDPDARPGVDAGAVEDRWILSRLERAKASVHGRIESYDFSHAALALYDFVYGELCDWYLELVKPRLYEQRCRCRRTLLHVLTETLALAHPMIPFVTEEIYSHHARAPRACSRPGSSSQAATAPDEAGRGGARARDRGGPGAARVARPRRREGRRPGSRAARRRRLRADRRAPRAAGQLSLTPAMEAPPSPRCRSPAARSRSSPATDVDLDAAERKREAERAQARAARSSAPRASSPTRASSPRRRRRSSQAERDKLARLRAELEAL